MRAMVNIYIREKKERENFNIYYLTKFVFYKFKLNL